MGTSSTNFDSRVQLADNVWLFRGDLFQTNAEVIVIPKSTTGTVSEPFERGLSRYFHFPLPVKLEYQPLGEIYPLSHVALMKNGSEKSVMLIFATSVDNDTSKLHFIEQILGKIIEFSGRNSAINRIALPLLGTGAGQLAPLRVLETMLEMLSQDIISKCEFQIYAMEDVYEELLRKRKEEDRHSGHRSPPSWRAVMGDELALQQFFIAHPVYMLNGALLSEKDRRRLDQADFPGSLDPLSGLEPGSIVVLWDTNTAKDEKSIVVRNIAVVVANINGSGKNGVEWVSMSTIEVNFSLQRAAHIEILRLTTKEAVDFFSGIPQLGSALPHCCQQKDCGGSYDCSSRFCACRGQNRAAKQ